MDVRKFQRVPPFTFFGTVTLFKNHILKFFMGNFFQSLKGPPFKFFHILQPAGVSQSPKGPPFYIFRHCDTVHFIFFIFCHQLEFHKTQRVPLFTILSLRYSADFGRSRLVHVTYMWKNSWLRWLYLRNKVELSNNFQINPWSLDRTMYKKWLFLAFLQIQAFYKGEIKIAQNAESLNF